MRLAEGFTGRQREAWASPPVDDRGYFPDLDVLADADLIETVAHMRNVRFTGWRNHGGRWLDMMGLSLPSCADVLDFGCGVGLEAVELGRLGGNVWLADLVPQNTRLASRVMRLHGLEPAGVLPVYDEPPYIGGLDEMIDVFHCCGVLHHIPWAEQVMSAAWRMLRRDGIARLMLYSDKGWRIATGTEPPDDVTAHPAFMQFVRFMDAVGEYADWYDFAKLQRRFGRLFRIGRCEYLTPDGRYLAAVLHKRSQ